MAGIPLLPITNAAQELATRSGLAVAATQGMDFMLTWNCRHIANAEVIERLECAPEQLIDGRLKS